MPSFLHTRSERRAVWRAISIGRKDNSMKKVYICAPLGGAVQENLERVKAFARFAFEKGAVPVAPHFYAFCLDDRKSDERAMALRAGQSLLWLCDELWVFGTHYTRGMRDELSFAKHLNIPVKWFNDEKVKKILREQKEETRCM